MLSFECIKNEKSVYFLLTSAVVKEICHRLGNHRGIRPQILQSLKKCDIYEKMISEKSIKEPVEYQKEQKFVEDKMYGGMVL